MIDRDASRDTERAWAALKAALIRSHGREGGAEFLRWAAHVMAMEGRREIIELVPEDRA